MSFVFQLFYCGKMDITEFTILTIFDWSVLCHYILLCYNHHHYPFVEFSHDPKLTPNFRFIPGLETDTLLSVSMDVTAQGTSGK